MPKKPPGVSNKPRGLLTPALRERRQRETRGTRKTKTAAERIAHKKYDDLHESKKGAFRSRIGRRRVVDGPASKLTGTARTNAIEAFLKKQKNKKGKLGIMSSLFLAALLASKKESK